MRLAHSHVFGDSVHRAFFELLQPKFYFAQCHTAPPCQNKKTVGLQVHGFRIQISIYLSKATSFSEKDFGTIFVQSVEVVEHAWFGVSVSFRDGKFLLEVVGILSLSKYSWAFGLQIVSLGTYGMHCEIFFGGSWNLSLSTCF